MAEKQTFNPDSERAAQLGSFMGNMAAAATVLGKELAKDAVSRGDHRTKYEARADGFGTFTKKWEYDQGCEPLTEIAKWGVGEITAKLVGADGSRKAISLGKTPLEWSAAGGKHLIEGAGEPGEYLLAIADLDSNSPGVEATTFRYLDESDLANVRIVVGESAALNENQERQRQIVLAGTVEEVSGLLV